MKHAVMILSEFITKHGMNEKRYHALPITVLLPPLLCCLLQARGAFQFSIIRHIAPLPLMISFPSS